MVKQGSQKGRGYWLSYINICDLDATLEKALTLGAKQVREAITIPDVGTLAVILDPEGAELALWQKAR